NRKSISKSVHEQLPLRERYSSARDGGTSVERGLSPRGRLRLLGEDYDLRAGQIAHVNQLSVRRRRHGDVLATSAQGPLADQCDKFAFRVKPFHEAFRFSRQHVSVGPAAHVHRVGGSAEALQVAAPSYFSPLAQLLAVAIVASESVLAVFRHEDVIPLNLHIHLAAAAPHPSHDLLRILEIRIEAP